MRNAFKFLGLAFLFWMPDAFASGFFLDETAPERQLPVERPIFSYGYGTSILY